MHVVLLPPIFSTEKTSLCYYPILLAPPPIPSSPSSPSSISELRELDLPIPVPTRRFVLKALPQGDLQRRVVRGPRPAARGAAFRGNTTSPALPLWAVGLHEARDGLGGGDGQGRGESAMERRWFVKICEDDVGSDSARTNVLVHLDRRQPK